MAALRVSAVVNNYNYGRYLGEAVESVLRQERHPDEIVVVDDGSTDDSRAVIARFGSKVKPVLREHRGQAAALTAGLEAATGDVACLLDSDDWWAPDKLRRVEARFAAEPNVALVQHWTREVHGGRPLGGRPPEVPSTYRLSDYLNQRTYFTGTTGLSFRLKAVRPLLPVPESLTFCADEYLYTHALFQGDVATIPEFLGFRRVHDANLFARRYRSRERLEDSLRVRRILNSAFEERLASLGLSFSEERRRARAAEVLQDEYLLRCHEGRRGEALEVWRRLGETLPGGYGAFKKASLLAALASPGLYLALAELYARVPGLVGLRRAVWRDPAERAA
ncbi:MAG: glycosyltransferase family 2 protein [Elusimicrobia bacterium]|nr:glycosyltransferase family 2 protein [Elusimicrobiota bacterium]